MPALSNCEVLPNLHMADQLKSIMLFTKFSQFFLSRWYLNEKILSYLKWFFYQFLWVWQLLALDMENFNVTNNNIENVL